MMGEFDRIYVIKLFLENFPNHRIPFRAQRDSQSLFDSSATVYRKEEKRLLIDRSILRDTSQNRKIAPLNQNPSDGYAKKQSSQHCRKF